MFFDVEVFGLDKDFLCCSHKGGTDFVVSLVCNFGLDIGMFCCLHKVGEAGIGFVVSLICNFCSKEMNDVVFSNMGFDVP
jgi:hypothetical protein